MKFHYCMETDSLNTDLSSRSGADTQEASPSL